MTIPPQVPLEGYERRSDSEMAEQAQAFFEMIRTRRTVRTFRSDPVSDEVLDWCLRAAGSAPSGANQQPWRFVVVRDVETKRAIRAAAEKEERAFYASRAPQAWLDALAPLGTDAEKPFLEIAPVLIAIFEERWVQADDGTRTKRYYATESVGLATGMLLAALHQAGLATLTHTPSPMGFLRGLLGRPEGERPFLLLVVGHPAEGTEVPDIQRKALHEIVERR